MSTAAPPAAAHRSAWIVSPWWDLGYVVVTPLAIVPLVLVAARQRFTPEDISLAVIAFASLGHHLPGFMRSYGDAELFRRYRWRFLLMPPLVFALALLFTPPESLRAAFDLPWSHFHGLELVLLVWGTWHGLMQTYGFMRIYDLRRGVNDRRTARLDHALCLCVFLAGVVFSDARVFGVADAMWQSGLPLFGPEWIRGARQVVGGVGLLVLAAYALHLYRARRRGEAITWLKLLLIGTTGWFYWYTGRLSTNVLIGLAMFEIYHAVQYYAIVWVYNRRLMQRAGERFGPLGFLFRDRWTMLGIYLAGIVAYSSIRYFTVDTDAYVFRGGGSDAYQWLVALFVTSSFLHFYFDGFIWKVSERRTQENLVDAPTSSAAEHYVPALVHAMKVAVLFGVAGWLLYSELEQPIGYAQRETERIEALARLTPGLPECMSIRSGEALANGDASAALEYAERAIALRPRSHSMLVDAGLALRKLGRLDEAQARFEQAIAIAPEHWSYHCDLGDVLARQGDVAAAEQEFLSAVRLRTNLEDPYQFLANFYVGQADWKRAEEVFATIAERFPHSVTAEINQVMLLSRAGRFDKAIELANFLVIDEPDNWRVHLALGAALNGSGAGEAAMEPLGAALYLRPRSPDVWYQIGLTKALLGRYAKALEAQTMALRFEPQHAEAQIQAASLLFLLGRYEQSLAAYAKAWQLTHENTQLAISYGGMLATLGETQQAEEIYRTGLEANPECAELNYNLAVLLWQQENRQEAKQFFYAAEEQGLTLPGKVRTALDKLDSARASE